MIYILLLFIVYVIYTSVVKHFYIFKGFHFSFPYLPKLNFKNLIEFKIKPIKLKTNLEGVVDKYDVSKFPGIANFSWKILKKLKHQNGVRLGWDWNEGGSTYNLFLYWYIDGKNYFKYIDTLYENEEIKYSFIKKEKETKCIIRYRNKIEVLYVPVKLDKINYYLSFYFGGNLKSDSLKICKIY